MAGGDGGIASMLAGPLGCRNRQLSGAAFAVLFDGDTSR
jgi:hypothetical protein